MEKILIPAKTYHLYVSGKRTFIHVKKEREEELRKLKFCEKVLLVNEENQEEFIEQTFWFIYSFKKAERFIFLAFKWERGCRLHFMRMQNVKEVLKYSKQDNYYDSSVEEDCEIYSHSMMLARSSFFYVTEKALLSLTQLSQEGRPAKKYVSIDTLRIKKGESLDTIEVYSMVPLDLFYLDC